MVHGAEACRTAGYGVLRTAQEAEPGVIPARLPSHDYGRVHLGLSQIFARYVVWTDELENQINANVFLPNPQASKVLSWES